MAEVAFKQCKCKSEYQDRINGVGVRTCNPNSKGGFKCTVCGATFGGGEKKK